jgi:hypothetical protein
LIIPSQSYGTRWERERIAKTSDGGAHGGKESGGAEVAKRRQAAALHRKDTGNATIVV